MPSQRVAADSGASNRLSTLSADSNMVGLAQLVEHRIVVPGVVGSSPISHPTKNEPGKAGLIHNRKEIGM